MRAGARFVLLVAVGFVVTGPGFGWVYDHYGANAVLVLVLGCGAMAVWLGHTPETQDWSDRVRRVLARLDIKHTTAARACRMTDGQFSDQLTGRERPQPLRFRTIGPEFNAEMAADECESHGYTVLRRGEISVLVRVVQALRAKEVA